MDGNKLKFKVSKAAIDFNIEKHRNVAIKSKPPRVNPMVAFMNAPAEKAKAGTYKEYFKQGGLCMTVMFLIMLILQYSGQIFLQVFIGMWT